MSKFSLFHDMASGQCKYVGLQQHCTTVQAEKNHIRHQQHWLQLVTNSLNIAYISCTIFAHLAVCPRQRPKLTPTTNFPANYAQMFAKPASTNPFCVMLLILGYFRRRVRGGVDCIRDCFCFGVLFCGCGILFWFSEKICHSKTCFVGHRVGLQADAKISITRAQFDFWTRENR